MSLIWMTSAALQVWVTAAGPAVARAAPGTSSPATTSWWSTPTCRRTTGSWTSWGSSRAWGPAPPSTRPYWWWTWRAAATLPPSTAPPGWDSLEWWSPPSPATTPGPTRAWPSPTWTPGQTSGTSFSPPASPLLPVSSGERRPGLSKERIHKYRLCRCVKRVNNSQCQSVSSDRECQTPLTFLLCSGLALCVMHTRCVAVLCSRSQYRAVNTSQGESTSLTTNSSHSLIEGDQETFNSPSEPRWRQQEHQQNITRKSILTSRLVACSPDNNIHHVYLLSTLTDRMIQITIQTNQNWGKGWASKMQQAALSGRYFADVLTVISKLSHPRLIYWSCRLSPRRSKLRLRTIISRLERTCWSIAQSFTATIMTSYKIIIVLNSHRDMSSLLHVFILLWKYIL